MTEQQWKSVIMLLAATLVSEHSAAGAGNVNVVDGLFAIAHAIGNLANRANAVAGAIEHLADATKGA